jgi:hypothetical protein
LEEEGHDPETFNFEPCSDIKTPMKRTRRTGSALDQESEEAPTMEDMIVQDDAGEEEGAEQVELEDNTAHEEKQEKMEVDDKTSRKRESQEESEASQPKKPCIENENKEDDHKVENNTDAEDSINLDLGEDELLNEEVRFYFFRVTVKLPAVTTKVTNGFLMEVDELMN